MTIKTVVASKDPSKLGNFITELSVINDSAFHVSSCKTVDEVNNSIESGRCEILIADLDIINECSFENGSILVVSFTYETLAKTPANVHMTLNPFAKWKDSIDDLFFKYADLRPEEGNVISPFPKHLTVVYSPSGGAGNTSVAIAYAMYRAAAGKSVQFFSFEEIPSTASFFGETSKCISTALEDWISGNRKYGIGERRSLASRLGSCRVKYAIDKKINMYYIAAPKNYRDVHEINRYDKNNGVFDSNEKTREILLAMEDSVDELIIDLPSLCGSSSICAYEHANKIILVSEDTVMSANKLSWFMETGDLHEYKKSNTTYVVNKYTTGKAKSSLDNPVIIPMLTGKDPMSVAKEISTEMQKYRGKV